MKHFILLCCLFLFGLGGRAQSVTATTGGEGQAGVATVAYTVGETFIATLQNDAAILTQGFHQPRFITTALKETFLPGTVQVFPNPTTAMLQVRLREVSLENIVISLHDVAGKCLASSPADTEIWQTDLSAVAAGCYFLTVTDIKTKQSNYFKILKIN